VGLDETSKNKIIEYKLTKNVNLNETSMMESFKRQESFTKKRRFSYSPYGRKNDSTIIEENPELPKNVLAVLPFHDTLEDLNIPGLNHKLNCLTNFHKGKVSNLKQFRWLQDYDFKINVSF